VIIWNGNKFFATFFVRKFNNKPDKWKEIVLVVEEESLGKVITEFTVEVKVLNANSVGSSAWTLGTQPHH
jgi:predicted SnoaL-like aldol condensation-catalyzing enzyme